MLNRPDPSEQKPSTLKPAAVLRLAHVLVEEPKPLSDDALFSFHAGVGALYEKELVEALHAICERRPALLSNGFLGVAAIAATVTTMGLNDQGAERFVDKDDSELVDFITDQRPDSYSGPEANELIETLNYRMARIVESHETTFAQARKALVTRTRPPEFTDTFYEDCVKLTVFYNILRVLGREQKLSSHPNTRRLEHDN